MSFRVVEGEPFPQGNISLQKNTIKGVFRTSKDRCFRLIVTFKAAFTEKWVSIGLCP